MSLGAQMKKKKKNIHFFDNIAELNLKMQLASQNTLNKQA